MDPVQNLSQMMDPEMVKELFSIVTGKSSIATLCARKPMSFKGSKYFVFSLDQEAAMTAESQKRSHGGLTVEPVKATPYELEYGARVSEDFMYASEEEQLDLLEEYLDACAAIFARGLDIMAFHGMNPRTEQVSDKITMHFDKIEKTVNYNAAAPDDCVEDAIEKLGDRDVTGIAMARPFASAMGKRTDKSGNKLYPGLAWGGNPKEINGVPSSVNSTVNFGDSKDMAIVGDFAKYLKWGFAKEVKMDIIPYGDPDNTGVDLKGSGQVYLRCTASLGFAILLPDAFARVVEQA